MIWLSKLLSGFNIFGGTVKGERLGKIIYVSIICLIVMSIVGGVFWKVFLEKKIKNVEDYYNCNVTNVHDCSVPIQEALDKYQYKPFIDIKFWKFLRIGILGK